MIFEYLNHTYCVNCDWLQFSVIIDNPETLELECPDGFRLEILPGNNVFRHRAIVWRVSDCAKFMTLLWHPYSRKIKSRIMTCQIHNMLLYQAGITQAFSLLQEITPCYFNSMGRIDICLDFQAEEYELKVIRELWEGSCYVQGKSEGATWWHAANDERGRFVHCLNWGSTSSEIKVKIYNKHRELGICDKFPDGDKPWIVSEWNRAGMDKNKVWRIEFSLKSSGQLEWNGKAITLENITQGEWLIDVFTTLYNGRFICRQNLGLRKGHKNNDPIVRLLVLPNDDIKLRWKGSEKETTATSEQITLLRKLMSTIELPAVTCSYDVFEPIANSIIALCEHKGVTSYFQHAYGRLPYDLLSERAEEIGGGIREVIPRPNQDI